MAVSVRLEILRKSGNDEAMNTIEIPHRIKEILEDGRFVYPQLGKGAGGLFFVNAVISYPAERMEAKAYSADLKEFGDVAKFEQTGVPFVRILNYVTEANDSPYDRSAFIAGGRKVSDVIDEPGFSD